jgi:AAA15 family ATPase/GTPase
MVVGDYDRGTELIPFKLDKESRESSTKFKLRTTFNGVIYTYSLELNKSQIILEKLEYSIASTKRERLLYSRFWNKEFQKFDWKNGSDFSGAHNKLKNSLQIREPFTSLFPRLNIHVIKPLIDWLYGNVLLYNWGHDKLDDKTISWSMDFTQKAQSFIPEWPNHLENGKYLLLKLFDTGIYDIEIRKNKDDENYQVYALHKTKDNEIISWKFDEESTGTQHLFTLAYMIQLVFHRSCLLRSDELGSNIHPNMIRNIVRIFQNPQANPNRVQLIFTSHDNTLQRNNLLRRDQIWFTQKRPDQSTELYSLSDFKVRNDLAIDKAYLDGRFGAVPFISDEDDFMSLGEDNG